MLSITEMAAHIYSLAGVSARRQRQLIKSLVNANLASDVKVTLSKSEWLFTC